MRRISGLVLAAAVLLPVSYARAADVTQLYSNNQFASATSTDPNTGATIGVFVTREKGKGEPRDSVFLVVSGPTGTSLLSGTLPKGAVHFTAKSASLEVDVADIVPTFEIDFPASGVVSVNWQATDITRTSGSTKQEFGNVSVNTVGTRTDADANVSGSFLGADLAAPTGTLSRVHESVIIHVSN